MMYRFLGVWLLRMYEYHENRLLTLKSEGIYSLFIFFCIVMFMALFLLILITNTAIKCIHWNVLFSSRFSILMIGSVVGSYNCSSFAPHALWQSCSVREKHAGIITTSCNVISNPYNPACGGLERVRLCPIRWLCFINHNGFLKITTLK